MLFNQIGIIGLGLMGGSILKGLEGKKEVLVSNDLLERLDEIDLLILAVPIPPILELGKKNRKASTNAPLDYFRYRQCKRKHYKPL